MKSALRYLIPPAIAVVIVAAAATIGRFTSFFVCRECGASARETEWQVPFTSFALYRQMTSEPTPLSRTLQSLNRIPTDHVHNWWLIHGSGNGIMCALGSAHDTYQAARSSEVSQLIQAAHTAGDTEFADRLIQQAFRRETASGVWMLGVQASLDGLPDSSSFDAWRRDHAELIETSLNKNR